MWPLGNPSHMAKVFLSSFLVIFFGLIVGSFSHVPVVVARKPSLRRKGGAAVIDTSVAVPRERAHRAGLVRLLYADVGAASISSLALTPFVRF